MPFNETFVPVGTPFYLSPKFWRIVLALILIVTFLIAFLPEVKLIWQLAMAYLKVLLGEPVLLPLTPETFRAAVILILSVSIAISGHLLLLFWISPFVLPVQGPAERWIVFRYLCRYSLPFHSHGPAIYVKDGKPLTTTGELDKPHAGVAFVDFRSALVLEQQYGRSKADLPEVYFESGSEHLSTTATFRPNRWQEILGKLRLAKERRKSILVRAVGPGLIFTQKGERIVGWADLRKQSRKRDEVHGFTRDGIEVKTDVSITFTLGQSSEILYVTKVKGDWQVIHLEELTDASVIGTNNRSSHVKVIKDFSDELDDEDKNDVDSFFRAGNFTWSIKISASQEKQKTNSFPYVFDPERVFQAVYSRARDAKAGILGEWTDLPVDVTVEEFRNMLAHETYDYLYRPEDPNSYPMKEFRKRFRTKLRNKGILGYQVVRRKDGRPLMKGQRWIETELVFSPPQEFRRTEVLRARGIKIITAGFSELIPTSDIIRQQFLDNWRAHWQQETEMTLAGHELEVTRILNRERAKAQQDMVYSLSQIFQTEQYTNEALAMRLYQALESAATHPATQRLLPGDTIHMLTNLRQWLLPKEEEKENSHADHDREDDTPEDRS